MSEPAGDTNEHSGSTFFSPSLRHPSREEAVELLQPLLDTLTRCIQDAWRIWQDLKQGAPEQGHYFLGRARAAVMHDAIWHRVKQELGMHQGVRFVEHGGLRVLHLYDKLTVRFKKLDRSYRSSNIKTPQQKRFAHQLPLDGFPADTRLTIGYLLDRLESGVEAIAITLPVGDSNVWAHVIPSSEAGVTITRFTEQEELPLRTRRVKPKKDDQDAAKNVSNE